MSLKTIDENGTLVPAPRNLPQDLFVEFERRDDDQILAELRGEVVTEYVYQFEQGGQTITGMSLVGVMAVAQQMGGITCGQPVWEKDDEEITCDISATDHKTGLTVWGTATEPRVMQTRKGSRVDKFARGKALSKAQRNAIRKLIPETVATKMLEMFLSQQGGGRNGRKAVSQRADAEPRGLPDKLVKRLYELAEEHKVHRAYLQNHVGKHYGGRKVSELTVEEGKAVAEWIEGQNTAPDAIKEDPARMLTAREQASLLAAAQAIGMTTDDLSNYCLHDLKIHGGLRALPLGQLDQVYAMIASQTPPDEEGDDE